MGKGRKVALLVGVGTYGAGLKPLQCPANGVTALQAVLETPKIGGFDEVIPLVDPDVGTMRARMGEVFNRLTKDDLVLFYFTGHGIKDMTGAFYLTTTQTQLFENGRLSPGTAIEASFVKSLIGNCYAQRKVVVPDCCFGAAFAQGFLTMDDGGVDVQADLGGEGYVVLTAATARNYALEQEGEPLSVYTRYLVEGLKTGAAAPEGKDYVSVGHLHDYVKGKVQTAAPTMNPTIFNGLAGQEIVLAKAVINPELIYRQKVQSKIRRGRLAPAGRRFLEMWQTQLNLGAERAAEIEAEVLKPFAEKQRHLKLYATTVREEVEHESHLDLESMRDLKDLQLQLNLSDEDAQKIHIQISNEHHEKPFKILANKKYKIGVENKNLSNTPKKTLFLWGASILVFFMGSFYFQHYTDTQKISRRANSISTKVFSYRNFVIPYDSPIYLNAEFITSFHSDTEYRLMNIQRFHQEVVAEVAATRGRLDALEAEFGALSEDKCRLYPGSRITDEDITRVSKEVMETGEIARVFLPSYADLLNREAKLVRQLSDDSSSSEGTVDKGTIATILRLNQEINAEVAVLTSRSQSIFDNLNILFECKLE